MIQTVTFENSTFADPPQRFEAGTAALGPAVGLGAAVDYLDRIGMENVARHERELLAYASEALGRIPGARLIGTAPEKAGVVSFVTDKIPAEEMGKILDEDASRCVRDIIAHNRRWIALDSMRRCARRWRYTTRTTRSISWNAQCAARCRNRKEQAMSTNGKESFEILPIAGRIGAEIAGVRLSGDLEPATVESIRQALFRYKVIFFRGQAHLDEGSHEAFGRLLGDIVPHPTVPSVKGTEAVLDIDGTYGNRATAWHTDVTFVDAYPQASILRALIVPTHGGDTAWANTAAAYQSLPPKLQEIANNLWAVHSNAYDYSVPARQARPEALKRYFDVFASTVYETEHPVVRIHPGTGERTLILGAFLRKFVDLPQADSKQLFALLQGYVTRLENTVRWRWSVGDVAMWDNRATQHVAIDDYGKQPRLHRRVTVAGDVPISIDGRRSRVLKKESAQREPVPAAAS